MSIEVGKNVKGKVTGLAKFGAFVDIGNNQTGLVHISEVSDRFIKDINDELSVGDEITVRVVSIKDDKIGLSIRQAKESPPQSETKKTAPSQKAAAPSRKSSSRGKNFDALMSSFLKESEDRLSDLRRSTEGKRGGRGGRRN